MESIVATQYFLNSIVSTLHAKALVVDIKHFYLNKILPDPEYMKLNIGIIPQEIIEAYNLNKLMDAQS